MLVEPPQPQAKCLDGLANAILAKCTCVEEEVVGVIRILEQKLVLQDSPSSDDQQQVRLQVPSTTKRKHNMFIHLKVLTGSLLTEDWNKFSRFDDGYQAHLTINDEEHLLWEVNSLNPYNLKVTDGTINWHWMKKLQKTFLMNSITGLHFFAKILMQFILAVPIYRQQQKYVPPMPATYMHNYLAVAMTCPFVCTISPVPQPLQKYNQAFQCEDGSARWLRDYTLSWRNNVTKMICKQSAAYSSKEYAPLVSYEHRYDVGLRVVEMFKSPLSTVDETAAVIELLYFTNWSKIVRFVVIDIESLYLAFEDSNKLTWSIAVFDEIDWIQQSNDWLQYQSEEVKATDLHRVDFRNSSQWGRSRSEYSSL